MAESLRKEIEKMKSHRAAYFPAMENLLQLHRDLPRNAFPIKFSEMDEMVTILELLDIGYLEKNSFNISESFGNVNSLSFTGSYPLSSAGEAALKQMKDLEKKKRLYIIILSVTGILLLIFLLLLVRFN
jgi:hypothetical protein